MDDFTSATVFVVDDDQASRGALAALVDSMGLEARLFSSAEDFLSQFNHDEYGCVVTDLRMLGMSGLELQEELVKMEAALPVILITAYADIPIAVRAMSNGAVTVLEKPCRDQQLWEAIRSAIQLSRVKREQLLRSREIRKRMDSLTGEEEEVIKLILDGKPNKTIATRLDMGLRTVETKRSSIMAKLKANSLAELVQIAVSIE